MARSLGSALPETLLTRFSPDAPPTAGRVVLIVTIDTAGLPHPALLADAEVMAPDARALRLAVHPASRTAANLREPGVASLALIEPEAVLYVKLRVRDAFPAGSEFACFEADVVEVLADVAHSGEAGARLVSGARFEVADDAAWVERVARARRALQRQE